MTPRLRALAVALASLVPTACGSPGPTAATVPPSSPHEQQTAMNAIKQGIDELAAQDLSDIASLDKYLSAQLREEESGNQWFAVRRSRTGRFAGLATDDIELRVSRDNAAAATLIIHLAEPGPDAMAFMRQYWPDAEFHPPRPGAAGSNPYWSIRQGGSEITIGGSKDQHGITGISLNRAP